jgi:hypothetical protein
LNGMINQQGESIGKHQSIGSCLGK